MRVTPSALLRNITAGSVGSAAWPKDLLESLLASILRAERAMPDHAQLLMGARPLLNCALTGFKSLNMYVQRPFRSWIRSKP